MEDPDCIRLHGAFGAMRIKIGLSEVERITPQHADNIRAKAHLMGQPSIALAQAFMSDLNLGQKQVIGEWVPNTEAGDSDIEHNGRKWLPGLQWSQIDPDFIMHYLVGDERVDIELKRGARMVMEELGQLRRIPKSGPLIVFAQTQLPFTGAQFRTRWRMVATAAGVPKSMFNVQFKSRHPAKAGKVKVTRIKLSESATKPIDGEKVWKAVREACRVVPESCRDDVAGQVATDVIAGKLALDQIKKALPDYVTRFHKTLENRFTTRSLDQPLPGRPNTTLGDTIPADHEIWR